MLLKKAFMTWGQKFICGWLIFCIGGIGSLTYFDAFLPGHAPGQHPYHLSILEESDHHYRDNPDHKPPTLISEARVFLVHMQLWALRRFRPEADFIMPVYQLAPGLAQFFVSGLASGYLVVSTWTHLFNHLPLFGSVAQTALFWQSAWLAPPEKPPIAW
jgi:hypothetical protein